VTTKKIIYCMKRFVTNLLSGRQALHTNEMQLLVSTRIIRGYTKTTKQYNFFKNPLQQFCGKYPG
jgi:hypothetical protein